MGSCLCKGHKAYLQSTPCLPVPVLQSSAEGSCQPSGTTSADERTDSGYAIGELANSSLMGLVATIKAHITQPTAMAQGRVARLIEWKGWRSEGGVRDDWRKEGCGWGEAGVEPQEEEQLYSHLAEEIRAARFAAGVAEQFAISEASLSFWSTQQQHDEANGTYAPLQDPAGPFLSEILLDDVGLVQRLYGTNQDSSQDSSPPLLPPQNPSCSTSSPWHPDTQYPLQERRTSSAIQQADSCSLSEDEVFYD